MYVGGDREKGVGSGAIRCLDATPSCMGSNVNGYKTLETKNPLTIAGYGFGNHK